MDVNEYLNTVWLGNTVRTWMIAAAFLTGAISTMIAIKALLVGRFFRFAARTTNEIDDLVVQLLKRTRLTVLIILAIAAVSFLMLELMPTVRTVIKFVAVIALFFQGMSWGNAIISFWVQRYASRRGMTTGPSGATVGALVVLARILLFLILFLFALDNLGFEITPLITGLGIGGIAVALAVQNILGDLFAALSIVLDKPFAVGDFIVIDTHSGTVEHIGLKSTRLRSLSGEQIIIGNADLLKARINNFQRMVERRAVFRLGVVYETSEEQLSRIPGIVRLAIVRQNLTRFDRCHLKQFTDNAIEFETVFWMLTADYNVYMDTQQTINLEIFRRFSEEKIELAHRTRVYQLTAPSAPPATP
jgi:small-conductance mechanosensitive channel